MLLLLIFIPSSGTASPVSIYPDTLDLPQQRLEIAKTMRPARQSVGLAFSGGGANGMAQIGVLKALEEENIPIDFITGTSIGAIIGGLYSAGYSASELERIAEDLPWNDLLSFNDEGSRGNTFIEQQKIRDRATIAIRFSNFKLVVPRSLSAAQNLTRTLDLLCMNAPYHPQQTFDDLPIGFRAVTTDLDSAKRITLDKGSLTEAMRASSTVPVLFQPVEMGEWKLADGGLVANLAVDELERANIAYKIAIDTRGSMYTLADDIDIPWKAADQAMTILIELQYPRQLEKADVVITPDVRGNTALDFSDIPGLIEAGYRSGKALAGNIREGIVKPLRHTTPLKSYRTTLTVSGLPTTHAPDFYEAGAIIRNSSSAEEALKKLLETGLFTHVHAVADREKGTLQFLAETTSFFEDVIVNGPENGPEKPAIDSCFAAISGRWYTNSEGSGALENLLRLYRSLGMSLVEIEKIVISDKTLSITMSDGKPGDILVTQNRNITRPTPIRRELRIDTSKVLKLDNVERSIDNLFATGAFNRVSVGIAESEPEESEQRLRIRLDEKPGNVLRLGLRYDETYKAQALFDLRNENLNGTADSFGGWAKISEKNYRLNLEYYMPRIGSTNLTFMTKLFYDHLVSDLRTVPFSTKVFKHYKDSYDRYSFQQYGWTSAFGTRIGRNGQLLLDLTLQNAQSFTDENQGLYPEENNDMALVAVEFTLDNRDDSLLPTSGRYSHLQYRRAPSLFNKKTFWALSGEHEENISFDAETSAQLSIHLGLSDAQTPLTEQFFIGGAGSPYSRRFIGLKERDLSGNNMLLLGTNIRYSPDFAIIFPSSFEIYYNVGQIWDERFSLDEMIHGIGAGLTWKTPIGPARFTAAKAFTFESKENDSAKHGLSFAESVFYFSLGHEF